MNDVYEIFIKCTTRIFKFMEKVSVTIQIHFWYRHQNTDIKYYILHTKIKL